MKLNIETNARNCLDVQLRLPSDAQLMITAPLREGCWLFRIVIAPNVVLTAVPVFGGINICLQTKPAGEVFMPSESSAKEIRQKFCSRIKTSVPDGKWVEAVKMLQAAIKKWRGV